MKVAPSNQTLILAGEPLPARYDGRGAAASAARGGGSASAPAKGATQHLTVIAAQPGSTVLVINGGYGAAVTPVRTSVAAAGVQNAVVTSTPAQFTAGQSGVGSRDSYGNPSQRTTSTLSAYLQPAEQYARTQRNLQSASSPAHLDVHV